ncbi:MULTISPECIES: glutathione peroxidase [unclassified Acidovorax]|uniref:glutathione peroxidase n=1 Tax=unclassified Acidovorax TaxID=2684926 RepID=UPI002882E9BA|nr:MULTISPECIES: glutathione peroxidase [unclassified Acidovorax]
MRRPVLPFSAFHGCCVALALASSAAFAADAPAASSKPANAATPGAVAACPALLNHRFDRLQDEAPQSLCQYAGKVVLVVNTASYCGFTGQYKGLEALYSKYRDRGLVVLGFPSNDFAQEGGSNAQIADFCENTFGVKFPMFGKTAVRGSDASPFYRQLAEQGGQAPRWNFHKYVVSRSGAVVGSFGSSVDPQSKQVLDLVEQQLAAKP